MKIKSTRKALGIAAAAALMGLAMSQAARADYGLTALLGGVSKQFTLPGTPNPESDPFLMLLSGIGLMGFVAYRRQANRGTQALNI